MERIDLHTKSLRELYVIYAHGFNESNKHIAHVTQDFIRNEVMSRVIDSFTALDMDPDIAEDLVDSVYKNLINEEK